jgi:hypothetical protein
MEIPSDKKMYIYAAIGVGVFFAGSALILYGGMQKKKEKYYQKYSASISPKNMLPIVKNVDDQFPVSQYNPPRIFTRGV